MSRNNNRFSAIRKQANSGNPHAMLTLSKLYRAGTLADPYGEKYIYWLERFFESPEINAILTFLDTDDEGNGPDSVSEAKSIYYSLDFYAQLILQNDIIEAGLELGLYYKNSCVKDELFLARRSLYNAWIASRFDYLEIADGKEKVDIVSILAFVDNQINAFGFEETD